MNDAQLIARALSLAYLELTHANSNWGTRLEVAELVSQAIDAYRSNQHQAAPKIEECRHEPYQGYCAHCNAPYVNGHAVVPPVPGRISGTLPEEEKREAVKTMEAAAKFNAPEMWRAALSALLEKYELRRRG